MPANFQRPSRVTDVDRYTEHNPIRPSWKCGWCPERWPCHTRRQMFLVDYAGALHSLYIYMLGQMDRATQDDGIARQPAGLVRDRFVGWVLDAQRVAFDEDINRTYLPKRMTQGRR